MEVILLKKVENLGALGTVVNVRPGYGRNYLIPRQKAVLVNKASLARLEKEKQAIATRIAEQKKRADGLAAQLEGKVVVISKRAGGENRLFGSVTNSDIAAGLEAMGIAVDKKTLVLPDAIKTIGEYKVSIKAGYQTTATILVQVVTEEAGDQQ